MRCPGSLHAFISKFRALTIPAKCGLIKVELDEGRDALMMIRAAFTRFQLVVSLVVAVLLILSCSDPLIPPVNEEIDRSDPDNLLLAFAKSYKEKDLSDYDECLDEDFLFQFTDDIADSLGLPRFEPWWGKTADVNSTGNMFGSSNVTDIGFSYEWIGEWASCQEVRDDSTFSGLCRRMEPLIVVVTTVDSEDPYLMYRVDESFVDVTVVPDRFVNGLWTIVRMNEVRKQPLQDPIVFQLAATGRSSWGGIKSLWR
jgi:hypothetical protein